jgi:hypothetical protein
VEVVEVVLESRALRITPIQAEQEVEELVAMRRFF